MLVPLVMVVLVVVVVVVVTPAHQASIPSVPMSPVVVPYPTVVQAHLVQAHLEAAMDLDLIFLTVMVKLETQLETQLETREMELGGRGRRVLGLVLLTAGTKEEEIEAGVDPRVVAPLQPVPPVILAVPVSILRSTSR